jgi:hypothetical protein
MQKMHQACKRPKIIQCIFLYLRLLVHIMQRNISIFDAKKLNRERTLSYAWHLLAYMYTVRKVEVWI